MRNSEGIRGIPEFLNNTAVDLIFEEFRGIPRNSAEFWNFGIFGIFGIFGVLELCLSGEETIRLRISRLKRGPRVKF